MAEIWIWNALASRRRSASDTFVENGLGVLKAAVEGRGHRVRLLDWANDRFYRRLAPAPLVRLSRRLTLRLLDRPSRAGGRLNRWLQEWIARIQRRRMAVALRRLAREVAARDLRVFGMKVWYGEAFSWAKYLAREIRKRAPQTLLVAGGYHVTLYEEDFLKNSPFDLAVMSEGETALSRMLDLADDVGAQGKAALLARIGAEARAGRLPNLLWRDGPEVKRTEKTAGDINAKAAPVYGRAEGKTRLHVLLESSGCAWGKCRFCVHQHLEPAYVKRRVDRIVDEIRAMRAQGIGLFRFAGSDTPPDFGEAIAKGILEAGLRIEYAMGSRARPDAKDPAVFEDLAGKYALMIRSGLRAVFMGGETGHDGVNEQVMNKGLTREDLIWTIRALREAEKKAGQRVDIALAMIYPTPLIEGATDADVMAANIELLREARPDSVMVTPPGVFKNSEWFARAKEFGFALGERFVPEMMEWEYVLYKPPELWSSVGLLHRGRGYPELLALCGRMRAAVEALGMPTDLSDEHFLMARACGYEGADGVRAFKRETLADIVSCDYRRLGELCERTNAYSAALAQAGAADARATDPAAVRAPQWAAA